MQPYYQDAHVTIYNADWRELKNHLEQNPVDAIITDPPFGLEEFAKGRNHGRSRLGGRANFVDDGWDKEAETRVAAYDMLSAAPDMLKKGETFSPSDRSSFWVKWWSKLPSPCITKLMESGIRKTRSQST